MENDVAGQDKFKISLMGAAFESATLKIFQEVASKNLLASTDELWKLLREKICNECQIKSLRSQFMIIRWNGRNEYIQVYSSNTAIHLLESI